MHSLASSIDLLSLIIMTAKCWNAQQYADCIHEHKLVNDAKWKTAESVDRIVFVVSRM